MDVIIIKIVTKLGLAQDGLQKMVFPTFDEAGLAFAEFVHKKVDVEQYNIYGGKDLRLYGCYTLKNILNGHIIYVECYPGELIEKPYRE